MLLLYGPSVPHWCLDHQRPSQLKLIPGQFWIPRRSLVQARLHVEFQFHLSIPETHTSTFWPSVDIGNSAILHTVCIREKRKMPNCSEPVRRLRMSLNVINFMVSKLPLITVGNKSVHQVALSMFWLVLNLISQPKGQKSKSQISGLWWRAD